MPWDEVMHKYAAGKLKSGSGARVSSGAQALGIMMSEKRKAGAGKSEYKSRDSALKHMRGG